MNHPRLVALRRFTNGLRRHLFLVVVTPIALLVMTQPAGELLLEAGSFREPAGPSDIYMKYWDAWYGKEVLAGRADFFHTDKLFSPQGMSLAYHNFSLPHMLVFGSLQELLPSVNAYVLTYLLIIVANLLSAYVFLLRLVSRPAVACVGAIAFGLHPFVRGHESHPELMTIATIPLTLYCLERVLRNGSWRWAALAGALVGLTAFTSLYTLVCLLTTLGIGAVFLGASRWREPRLWLLLLVMVVVAGSISLPRLYPMLTNRALLAEALDKNAGRDAGNDVIKFFVNADHTLLSQLQQRFFATDIRLKGSVGYLGILPLLLIGVWLARIRPNRFVFACLAVMLVFLSLRLGSNLVVGGVRYDGIPMPKQLIDQLFPALTKAFYETTNFQIGILLPFVALFSCSLAWLLRNATDRAASAAILLILLVVCFEYYSESTWRMITDRKPLRWIDWLIEEDQRIDTRLIQLPMGRQQSKRYGHFQTFHGFPHIEGAAARTPAESYAYIESNLLLSAWRDDITIECSDQNEHAYRQAADQLRDDGFTHIVYHGRTPADEGNYASFASVPSVYEDRYVRIYLVEDLQLACELPNLGMTGTLLARPSVQDRALQHVASLATITINSDSLITWRMPYSDMRVDLIKSHRRAYLDGLLSDSAAIALNYGALEQTDATPPALRDWLMQDFHSCGTFAGLTEPSLEALLRQGYPCELALSQRPLLVDYANGARLGNLVLESDDGMLLVSFLWNRFADDTHSFSLQLLDEQGDRVYGYDQIIDKQELQSFRIDTSALPPGDYGAKLIVYNYATRKSVRGVIVRSQLEFQREVDLGAVTLD